MRVVFLGTGTSHGIPVIGCPCPVCASRDPRDRRYRSSILIEEGGASVLVDSGPEFRLQALRAHISRLDAMWPRTLSSRGAPAASTSAIPQASTDLMAS